MHTAITVSKSPLHIVQDSSIPTLAIDNSTYLQIDKNQAYSEKLCQISVTTDYSSVFYRITETNAWIYSIRHPANVIYCGIQQNKPPESKILHGNVIVELLEGCSLQSKKFTLLPHSSGQTSVEMIPNQIHIPRISVDKSTIIGILKELEKKDVPT
ncbi:hypothetical protein PR048_013235, partial [Dryococelus australis]